MIDLGLGEILGGGALAVIAGATLIQITPIKLNPWSWLARTIGRAINKEVIEKVDELDKKLDKHEREAAEDKAISCRVRILRFGDEILHDVRHSKEHFDQILLDITEYEQYCHENPEFKNNMTALTTKRIKAIYEDCYEKNTFL